MGRAIAIALAEEGVHIVAHDRRAQETETTRVCGEVADCGAKSWQVLADLEKPEEYESLIAQALKAAGSLDILINNASIFSPEHAHGRRVQRRDAAYARKRMDAFCPFPRIRKTRADRGKIINLLDTRSPAMTGSMWPTS